MNDVLQGGPPCRGCEGSCTTHTASGGTFSMGAYSANSDCNWIIAPEPSTAIEITFNSMRIENGYDFVDVFSCVNIHCERDKTIWLGKLSGTQTGSYRSTTPYMLVKFTSDGLIEEEGFSATWNTEYRVCPLLT
jgi:hypothetical protein